MKIKTKTLFSIGTIIDNRFRRFFNYLFFYNELQDGSGLILTPKNKRNPDTLIIVKGIMEVSDLFDRPLMVQFSVGDFGKFQRRVFITPADYAPTYLSVSRKSGFGKYFLHFAFSDCDIYLNFIFPNTKN